MSGSIVDIAPAYIDPSPDNPRRDLGDLDELVRSIKAVGIQEPIIVRPDGKAKGHDRYELIAGARRLAAAERAGLMWVPCIVREYSPEQRLEIMLIENLQRRDLAPLEEATAFTRLIEEFAWSQEKVAERIGRSQSHVSKRLQLLDLSAKAQSALDSGRITVGDALELTKLKGSPKLMDRAMQNPANIPWSVKNVVAERDRGQKKSHLLQQLKGTGVKILTDADVGRYGAGAPRRIGKGAYEARFAGIDPKAHAEEPCHAAYIDETYDDATIRYYCTKPARHAKGGKDGAGDSGIKTGLSEEEKTKRRAKIEHGRARRAAQEIRDAFVDTLLKRKPSLQEATELLIASWADHDWGSGASAAERMGIKTSERDYGRTKHPRAFAAHLATTPRDTALLALVLAVEAFEKPLRTDYPDFGGARPYFDFLARHGYEVSAVEKLELAGKRPR